MNGDGLCAGCGGGVGPLVPSPACADRALVVAEREFSDPAYFAVHTLTVAAYTLQHPDQTGDFAVAVHREVLRGACVLRLDGEALTRHTRWAARTLRADPPGRLPRPADRGALTVVDVVAADSAARHVAVVRAWAGQVWAAWA